MVELWKLQTHTDYAWKVSTASKVSMLAGDRWRTSALYKRPSQSAAMGAASGCPLIVHVDHLVCLYGKHLSRWYVLLTACRKCCAELKANHSSSNERNHSRVVLHSVCTHRSVC